MIVSGVHWLFSSGQSQRGADPSSMIVLSRMVIPETGHEGKVDCK